MKSKFKYILLFFVGFSIGMGLATIFSPTSPDMTTEEEEYSWTQKQAEEEMEAIYNLLATQAFTMRTNMNLALKTNHYLTHSKKEQKPAITCPECLETHKEYVEGMPPLRGGNKMYFDRYYRQPLEKYLQDHPTVETE